MPANKKPRKAYRPKRKVGNILAYMAKTDPKVVLEDIVQYQISLEHILSGNGTIYHSDMVTGALNACCVLCLQHDWMEYYPIALAGQRAQKEMTDRVRAGKTMLYTGPEMTAVKDAMELYKEQLQLMTPKDMTNCAMLVSQTLVKMPKISVNNR